MQILISIFHKSLIKYIQYFLVNPKNVFQGYKDIRPTYKHVCYKCHICKFVYLFLCKLVRASSLFNCDSLFANLNYWRLKVSGKTLTLLKFCGRITFATVLISDQNVLYVVGGQGGICTRHDLGDLSPC